MFPREKTRQITVGNLVMGGQNKVIVQSMCNTHTKDIEATIAQIKQLEACGCELIRVAVLDKEDALAIRKIRDNISIPLVADIHFDYRLALQCIENGIDKIRINPGNIGKKENIEKVVLACKEKHIPIRIGVNAGSLEEDIKAKYGICAKAMIESAKRHISILEEYDFHDIVLSLKASNYEIANKAYKMAASLFDYPLHIGITEPGPLIPGIVKSTLGLSSLIDEGIGSTIRISISDDPIKEIKVAKQLLLAKGLICMPTLVSCPTCGRTQIDLIKYANIIEDYLYKVNKNIKVAVMGCVVNGIGEAGDADIGVSGGNGQAVLFKKGKIIRTIDESLIVKTLEEEIEKL